MSFLDIFKRRKADSGSDIEKSGGGIEKDNNNIEKGLRVGAEVLDFPIPIDSYIKTSGQVERVPIEQFSWNYLLSLAYNSDLIRTVIKTITDEVFKNGIEIKERWKSKCISCGREYEEDIAVCPYCLAPTIHPDYNEYKILREFLNRTNDFDEDFIDVLRLVDNDVNIGDNGYILINKRYLYDENDRGKIVGAEVLNIARLSPGKTRLIYSKYGMGRGEEGEYYYFCPNHRNKLVRLTEEDLKHEQRCDICGSQLIQAWYSVGDGMNKMYLGKQEVYHVKRWSNNQGYGVSPLVTVWRKVMTLLKMDDFILKAYSLQRSPRALLVLRGRLDTIRRAFEWLMQKSRENPNMIYPLVIEGEETGRRIIEYQPFDLKPEEWQWIEMRKEFRETVGAVFGIMPLFVEGAAGQGLTNEGLQITVSNRTISESQRVWQEFLDWLSSMLGAESYHYKIMPHEVEDELRDIDIESKRIDIAMRMRELGYNPILKRDGKGRITFDFENVEEWYNLSEEESGSGDGSSVEGSKEAVSDKDKVESSSENGDKEGSSEGNSGQ